MEQFSLAFRQEFSWDMEDFIVGESNRLAFDFMQRLMGGEVEIGCIVGPPKSGKSFLVNMLSESMGVKLCHPDAVEDALVQSYPLLIVDDIGHYSEVKLFHLYNHAQAARVPLIMTSSTPLGHRSYILPDVKSRMQSVVQYVIEQPDDVFLEALLFRLLAQRQLRVTPEVCRYLLMRLPRSYEDVVHMVDAIDVTSMSKGRNVTIPLVRGLFEEQYHLL